MKVAEWLDGQEAEGVELATLQIPKDILVNDDPDEIIFYREINECGLFCQENHPHAKVERFGHWFHAKGQDKLAGKHSDKMMWDLVTRDKNEAIRVARKHIE